MELSKTLYIRKPEGGYGVVCGVHDHIIGHFINVGFWKTGVGGLVPPIS